ncbi:MAG TPA: hypothetical protein VHP11_08785 [Tepidisphaeraceae bacterium]|nr:hypothetical protein [Tepidisphaeraceae bacterium]
MGRRKSLAAASGAVVLGAMGVGWAAEADAGKTPAPAAKSELAAVEVPKATERDWVDQVKQPTSWFKWGADQRVRQEYIHNPFHFDTDPPGHEWNFLRMRSRVWGTLSPAEQIDVNVRLAWENRYWFTPDSKPDAASGNDGPWDWSDVVFDNLNVKIKGVAGEKSSLTVGRQDIILGDGWLVLDGTPVDGSRTIYFDAARLSMPFEDAKTAVDLIAIQQYSDPEQWLPPISSRDYPTLTEQDETGAILWVTNKSIKDTELNGYFIYKHDNAEAANGDDGDIYTLGGRAVHAFNKNWSAQAEGAYQFGTRENPALFGSAAGNDLSAFGMNSRLTYSFNDEWKNRLIGSFEYLSGDDPDSSTNTQFDPLWGRWPQWSELYIYNYATETRIAETTNLTRLALGWQGSPTRKMDLAATYNLLWANELTRHDQGAVGFGGANFRGQLLTAVLRYKFNRFLSGHLLGEYFLPGGFYDDEFPRNDEPSAYLRWEFVVTF